MKDKPSKLEGVCFFLLVLKTNLMICMWLRFSLHSLGIQLRPWTPLLEEKMDPESRALVQNKNKDKHMVRVTHHKTSGKKQVPFGCNFLSSI